MRKIVFGNVFRESMRAMTGKLRCLSLGLVIVVIAVGVLLQTRPQNSAALARLNQPLPPLIVDASGEDVDLRTVASGTRRVIVFYSPTCRTCREVLPALLPFPENLRLIMVNESQDSADPDLERLPAAARFRDRRHALARAFTAAALPTFLFVDGGGILRNGLIGRHEPSFIQNKMKEFAMQPGGKTPLKP